MNLIFPTFPLRPFFPPKGVVMKNVVAPGPWRWFSSSCRRPWPRIATMRASRRPKGDLSAANEKLQVLEGKDRCRGNHVFPARRGLLQGRDPAFCGQIRSEPSPGPDSQTGHQARPHAPGGAAGRGLGTNTRKIPPWNSSWICGPWWRGPRRTTPPKTSTIFTRRFFTRRFCARG